MATLFRDERASDAPELQAKLERIQRDFPDEVRALANSMLQVAMLIGMANTEILVNSLLGRIAGMADKQQ
jgi:hypothetical protein